MIVIDICTSFINDAMILPEYAHIGDSGMDLQANIDKPLWLAFGETKLIKTGLRVALPLTPNKNFNWELQIRPRSGLAYKSGITVLNSPGTIDSHYRGEIGVLLRNTKKVQFEVKPGDRIAQAVLAKAYKISWNECNVLDETIRGSDGYGSTG